MALVDIVVVSYNSRNHLRRCVAPLFEVGDVNVVVVDNASADGSLEAIADLPVTTIARSYNGGFAVGCNEGWRAGSAPYVLFLNPDATIDEGSLRRLVDTLARDDQTGAVGPRVEHPDGSLAYSLRLYPRIRSTFARGLFLHRLFPRARWADELIRDAAAYEHPASWEWISGACILVRRAALEQLGGWDESFFLYCEDNDLCRRLHDAGYDVRYEPSARVVHEGGASAPSSKTLPILAASRLKYARKHGSAAGATLYRLGIAFESATHVLVSRGGIPARRAHAKALLLALSPRSEADQHRNPRIDSKPIG